MENRIEPVKKSKMKLIFLAAFHFSFESKTDFLKVSALLDEVGEKKIILRPRRTSSEKCRQRILFFWINEPKSRQIKEKNGTLKCVHPFNIF